MVEHRILFLQRFEKILDDGRYGEAVLSTRVEKIHKILNLQFLGSLCLGYNSAYVPTSTLAFFSSLASEVPAISL